jgi:hypothetical protein
MSRSPVLLIIFNRPNFSLQTAREIVRNRPSKLYVAGDGPRTTQEADLVASAREAVLDAVDGKVELITQFQDRNLGCKRGVESALTWFFEHEAEGIVLEDDCVPSPSFFEFCDLMLERYRMNDRVMHIAGYSPRNMPRAGYSFSQFPSVWGWATWRRAWVMHPGALPAMTPSTTRSLRAAFATRTEHRYFTALFDQVAKGTLDTWDYAWMYTILVRQGLTIRPNRNLVENIGVGDVRAAHTRRRRAAVASNPARTMDVASLERPALELPDFEADRSYFRWAVGRRFLMRRPDLLLQSLAQPSIRKTWS